MFCYNYDISGVDIIMHRLFNSGFTWLEIVVVTVILIFLASLIIPRYHVDGDSKIRKAKVQITEIVKALELYKQDNGFYPTTEQGSYGSRGRALRRAKA